MQSLSEKYRPSTWEGVIGQPKAIREIQTAARDGFGGKAF